MRDVRGERIQGSCKGIFYNENRRKQYCRRVYPCGCLVCARPVLPGWWREHFYVIVVSILLRSLALEEEMRGVPMLAISYPCPARILDWSEQKRRKIYLSRSPCIYSGEDNLCSILKSGLALIRFT